MKRVDLADLLAASANISVFADKLMAQAKTLTDYGMGAITVDRTVAVFMRSLVGVTDLAEWLALPATLAACERCRALVRDWRPITQVLASRHECERIAATCHQIATALSDELQHHHTYVVGPAESRLIDEGVALFGPEVVDRFPQIKADVAAAAKCRAYELWTASVMHMMRVAEVGVGALADHLGVKRGATWGGTIANLTEALKDASRAKADPDLRAWSAETGTYLNFVKDAFRNPAMHPERSFSAEEAVMIYDNSRAFMQMLAKRLAPG